MWFIRKQFIRLGLLSTCFLLFIFGLATVSSAQQVDAGVVWEPAVRIPSPEEMSAWLPDLAVDGASYVHVVWSGTAPKSDSSVDKPSAVTSESVYYTVWNGQQWSLPNDIVPPQSGVAHSALTISESDRLHLLFSGEARLFYQQAPVGVGLSAAAWTSPQLVNSRDSTFISDIAEYEDTLHVVYDDQGDEEGQCPGGCSDIFYRRSIDFGLTWSRPVNLSVTSAPSRRPQIEIDDAGTIYLAWDEGMNQPPGEIQTGVYIYSLDGGSTWSSPVIVSYPVSTNAQLAVGADGQGGVMLVWRTTSPENYGGIFYMWSTDYGATWSVPRILSNIIAAQREVSSFDSYDMATDSAGHIHLLVTGHLPTAAEDQRPGLYHFIWDGNNWSAPWPVYEGTWYPERPRLVIDRGNQLHATWFIRWDPREMAAPHQIWYAHGQSSAPTETPMTQPTPTPSPEPKDTATSTPTPTLTPRPTPTPTVDPGIIQAPASSEVTSSIYTDYDDILLLLKSLLPAILVVVLTMIGVHIVKRR